MIKDSKKIKSFFSLKKNINCYRLQLTKYIDYFMYINSFFKSIIILFFYSIIFIFLSFNIDLNASWFVNADQEVAITYNALLFNSGLPQEMRSHTGYFTILFLSLFFKFLSMIDILTVYNLKGLLNSSNFFGELQKLIFFSRIYSLICITFFFFSIHLFVSNLTKEKIFSFLLTLVLIFSAGLNSHIFQLRNEILSASFFILSLLNLILFSTKKKNYINLLFFFIFFYSAILNKSQVFFYLPFILIFSYFFNERKIELKINGNIAKIKNYKYYLIVFIILYFFLKKITNTADISSILYIIFSIFIFNTFIIFISKKNKIENNLIISNLILIFSFFLFKSFLFIHPSTVEVSFMDTFTNILSSFQYTRYYSPIDNTYLIKIYEIPIIFFKNFFDVLLKTFSTINFYSCIILFFIFLSFFYKNLLNKKDVTVIVLCFIIFFLISTINFFRFQNFGIYNVFSDFFLIIPYVYIYRLINKNFILYTFFLLCFFFILNYFYFNNNIYKQKKITCIHDFDFFASNTSKIYHNVLKSNMRC